MPWRSVVMLAGVLTLCHPALAQAQEASALFMNREGRRTGSATLTDGPSGVVLRVEVQNLTTGWHGLHLHAVGTCDDYEAGFKAAGGHFNPGGKQHGLLSADGPEAGDLPNLYVEADGKATAEFHTGLVSLGGAGGRPALLDQDGAAIVIHAEPDDHKSHPIGHSGDRIACAVIKKEP